MRVRIPPGPFSHLWRRSFTRGENTEITSPSNLTSRYARLKLRLDRVPAPQYSSMAPDNPGAIRVFSAPSGSQTKPSPAQQFPGESTCHRDRMRRQSAELAQHTLRVMENAQLFQYRS